MSYPGKTIQDWAEEVYKTAVEKGWWEDKDRNFGETIALMHSELSEALEEWRDDKPSYYDVDGKPEGWAIELMDCLIRILDFLEHKELDIGLLLRVKVDYNKTRSYRHGGKRA